ncbi:MAG: DUF4856 domain-containing protein [Myxococcota bacterium]|nr:DUF4856 domain-containing protein [Myxococcota bacterium]
MLKLQQAALGVAALSLIACGGDDHDHDHQDAGPAPVADAGPATDAGPAAIETPDSYNFESKFMEGSAVSYSGQTARQVILSDLKGEFSRISAELNDSSFVPSAGEVTARLNFFFRFDGETSGDLTHKLSTDPAPLQTTYNEISTKKNLVGKLAGNDSSTDYKDWSTEFTGHGLGDQITSPESYVDALFQRVDDAAVARVAGDVPLDPSGNEIAHVFVTPEGHDIQQILAKFIGMAVAFSQGADDYMDDDTDGKGLLASNAQYVKNGEPKPYSALGHAWDEGFGYFGAARNYLAYTDDEVAGKGGRDDWQGSHDTNGDGKIDLKSEINFLHSVNCAKRDRGSADSAKTDFTKDAMDHFLAGRTLIMNAGDTLSEAEMTQLKAHRDVVISSWEKCVAATVVHYINDTLQDMAKFGTDDYSFASHAKHWGELKGFALGLQFNPKSPLNNEITGEDMTYFQKFHQLIGAAPALPGSPDVAGYQSKLRQARSLLAERYGFAAANLGDDDGEDGW